MKWQSSVTSSLELGALAHVAGVRGSRGVAEAGEQVQQRSGGDGERAIAGRHGIEVGARGECDWCGGGTGPTRHGTDDRTVRVARFGKRVVAHSAPPMHQG